MKQLLLLILLFLFGACFSQDTQPFVPEGDAKAFDFWEGTWMTVKENGEVDSSSSFIVRRGVHPSCFYEEWQMAGGMKAVAIRSWDKTAGKWGFVWVSDNGLYQVWDTKKVNGSWYIYKEFTIGSDRYLSRQGFLPQPDGTVLRVSEKTYDEKTWELRFRQRLKRVK